MTTPCHDVPCTVRIFGDGQEQPEATFKVWNGFMFLWWFIRLGLKVEGSSGDSVELFKCNTLYQWEIFPPGPYRYRKFLDIFNGLDRNWNVHQ